MEEQINYFTKELITQLTLERKNSMNSLSIQIPFIYSLNLIDINWNDILFAISNGYFNKKKVVDDLLKKGCKVEIIPRNANVKTPDFKVNAILTELKTSYSTNINTIMTKIQRGFKQNARVVVIDARGTGLTVNQATQAIKRAAGTYKNKKLPGKVEIWTDSGTVTGGK